MAIRAHSFYYTRSFIPDTNPFLRSIREQVASQISTLKSQNPTFPTPKLVIVQAGERPDSTTYVKMKSKACKEVGIDYEHISVRTFALFTALGNW
jgi:methylenetetrahydrofolate dehydrogenase (NADP+)/methenyltetrahydrofolate cyclohydrolase/formyltetrahydrofolate synthetase